MGDEARDELVLTVEAAEVDELFRERGATGPYLPIGGPDFGAWLGVRAEFRRRSKVETNAAYRHLATYAMIRHGHAGEVFCYRRGGDGSEGRLLGKLSIGVGGHVGIVDYRPDRPWDRMLESAAFREIREELRLVPLGGRACLEGLIADDSDPVGCVHLGLVYRVTADPRESRPTPREGCLADPQWLTPTELRLVGHRMESWSRIVLTRLLGPAPEADER